MGQIDLQIESLNADSAIAAVTLPMGTRTRVGGAADGSLSGESGV
jgi:hypothetical protein